MLDILLLVFLAFILLLTFDFKYKLKDEIYYAAKYPKQNKLSILVFDLLSFVISAVLIAINFSLYQMMVCYLTELRL